MFRNAVKKGTAYTRPLLTGQIIYNERKLINTINTLLVINKDGDILTTGHIADLLLSTEELKEVFDPILEEMKGLKPKQIAKLEEKYGIKESTLIRTHNIIVQIASNISDLNIKKHPYLDLAIIKLKASDIFEFDEFPVFNPNELETGTSVCNLGFALPEYDAFDYDKDKEEIIVTNKVMNFPLFPLNGIVTRNVIDVEQKITMFENSAKLLPGQNGGPVLNEKGEVLGLIIGGRRIVDAYAKQFHLDLTVAIKSKVLCDFLDENEISYNKVKK